jgi:hypothetical protein
MSLEKPTFLKSKSKIETERFEDRVRNIADILMQPHPDIEQIYGAMFEMEKETRFADKNKVCAMGLLMYHHGYQFADWDNIDDFKCGVNKCPYKNGTDLGVYSYIIHLNDYHHLTFYQIGEELLKLCQQVDR